MNNLYKILLILSTIVFSLNNTQAQTIEANDNGLNDREFNELSLAGSEFKFPPLSVVIDSVLKQSAIVNFRKQYVRIKESTLKSERLDLTKNISVQGTTTYGNINNFSTNEDGFSNTASLTTTTQLNYSAGLTVKFSFFDFLNRKQQLKFARLEIGAAKSMVKSQEEEIRQTVIKLYQNLILKQKLLKIRSRMLGDGKVNKQMVEKEFRNGVVPLSEYVRINGMTIGMEAAYEIAMSEFITAKQLLEDMAGFVFDLTPSN